MAARRKAQDAYSFLEIDRETASAQLRGIMDLKASFTDEVLWDYQNLNNSLAVPEEAPSSGAWTQLVYGLENRIKFMDMVSKIRAKEEALKDSEEVIRLDLEKLTNRVNAFRKKRRPDAEIVRAMLERGKVDVIEAECKAWRIRQGVLEDVENNEFEPEKYAE